MYGNLSAEMARRGLNTDAIARVIGKSTRTTRDKLKGRYPLNWDEAKRIKDAFFAGMDLEYLFAVTDDQHEDTSA